MRTGLQWFRSRDAGLAALRRAGRAAIVMPAMLALSEKVIGDATVATFAAFGSLAMLLFVAFGGTMRERLQAQIALILAGAVFICLGTLAGRTVWLAAIGMFIAGFAVLFAGVVSSVLASASTALLLGFILPVTLPGTVSSIPARLSGWLLAGGASLVAVVLLWPAPAQDPLRAPLVRACALLGRRMRAEVEDARAGSDAGRERAGAAAADSAAAVQSLRTSFFATPYRPTGLTTSARILVRLVDELVWLEAILDRMPAGTSAVPAFSAVCDVKLAAADLLEAAAVLLDSATGDPAGLQPDLERLRGARDRMERMAMSALATGSAPDRPILASQVPASPAPASPAPASSAPGSSAPASSAVDGAADGTGRSAAEYVSSLEPSFRAQELSFAVSAVAENVQLAVAARQRTWRQQLLGRQPQGAGGALSSAQQRAGAHVERHSVWLHNSVRGAIALGLAVLVADLTGVQHSFWVVLGTLTVLRSNALSTGQNALRGLAGNIAGFVIGGALILAIGTNSTTLWLLLPLAVLLAGLAPAVISFAAGQAAFTITLLILYNIIAPAGWKVGLIRIEDVAIGCAVSLVVGALFWPRGAGAAFGQAASEAYAETARYLRAAVMFGVVRCDRRLPATPVPREESLRAAAAARRLDDAFRGFLAERGTKHLPLPDVAALITGVAVLRLSADAVLDLWQRDDGGALAGDRTAARDEVLAADDQVSGWYEMVARALAGEGDVPAELPPDEAADGRLIVTVQRDLSGTDGRGTATAVKMIWTADHVDVARRLQAPIAAPARRAAAYQRRSQRRSLAAARPGGPLSGKRRAGAAAPPPRTGP
ncbi:MAG: FUSC family protein [Streptosporangiaceae bacterium]